MKTVILVRYEEIFLKGLNRPLFENKLIKNMKQALYGLGQIKIIKAQSRIYVEPDNENYPLDEAINRLTKVFGISSVSPVWKLQTNKDTIYEKSIEMVKGILKKCNYKTFKVATKRGDKKFPLNSMEVSKELGAILLQNIPELKVDVINPDFVLHVEIREFSYVYSEIVPGVKGLPVGSNGLATLLISGGIDSPVAGWMIAKRGVKLEAVHFYSYPYTSERAKDKVIELIKIISEYNLGIKLHIIPFTDIQMAINQSCPHDYITIIMRRFMMKIAERIAYMEGAMSLVSGESLGQVASQTMESINATNNAVELPVFRPLIGMDKNEIIDIAQKIETFETSILPFEDCCTVFVPKHPETRPKLEKVLEEEAKADVGELIEEAIKNAEILRF